MVKNKRRLFTPVRVTGAIVSGLIIFSLVLWLLIHDKTVAVLNPQGIVAAQQKDLIIFTLLLSAVIVIPVFVLLGFFAWKYRESNTKATYTPDVEGNRWLELLWWGIPIIIIGILGYITIKSTHELDPYKPLSSSVQPITVQVVAMQWKWLFLYPDQKVASVNELRIPAGTPVNFQITADGPMSAFWIPSLGTQTYAMTGMTAKLSLLADKAGTYRGANSNINGKGYSDMTFNAVALTSKKAFDEWALNLGQQKNHSHLDATSYQDLAKPGIYKQPVYYHLHDTTLFDQVVEKYMHGGTLSDHADHNEGHHEVNGEEE